MHGCIESPTSEEVYGPAQVAEMFGVEESDLAEWRKRGCGPRYTVANGDVVYRAASIAEFFAACSGHCFGAGSASFH